MDTNLMKNILSQGVFVMFWLLLYVILGFETIVVLILLFILANMRKQK